MGGVYTWVPHSHGCTGPGLASTAEPIFHPQEGAALIRLQAPLPSPGLPSPALPSSPSLSQPLPSLLLPSPRPGLLPSSPSYQSMLTLTTQPGAPLRFQEDSECSVESHHMKGQWRKGTRHRNGLPNSISLNPYLNLLTLLEENVGRKLHDTGLGNDFLVWHQRNRQQKKK